VSEWKKYKKNHKLTERRKFATVLLKEHLKGIKIPTPLTAPKFFNNLKQQEKSLRTTKSAFCFAADYLLFLSLSFVFINTKFIIPFVIFLSS
jgi:hypothetical protein